MFYGLPLDLSKPYIFWAKITKKSIQTSFYMIVLAALCWNIYVGIFGETEK